MNCIFYSFIIIVIFQKCQMDTQKYLLIPFSLQQEKQDTSQLYDSNTFIQNNFYKNITFDFYIGDPPQKVNGIIINDNLCFELKIEKDLYTYNNFFNFINNKYKPKDSSTFSVINKELRWDKGQYMTLGSDFFKFENHEESYNLTFLLKKTDEELIDLDELKNTNYILKFGLNALTSFSGDECPNFMNSIKSKARLSKYLISFEFKDANNGYLVIGDELYNYNSKIYHESQHIGIYTDSLYNLNHNKEIIIDERNHQNITLNLSYIYLQYDLGVIIGTNEYKQIIDDIFFNTLIDKKICQIDKVKLNTTDNYYLYSCNENNLDIKLFPKIIFYSHSYNFNFELNYNDLFVKKNNNRYYFLILFKENNDLNTNTKEEWKMGEPFYKKYNFTINTDARILGFYNPNYDFEEDKEIKDEESNDKKGNNETLNNNSSNNIALIIIFIVLGSLLVAFLMFISFYYGLKMRYGRKIRANELNEDNYEYFPESTNDQNKLYK